ncbi:MAG: hypothetical protein WC091_24890 [Sulfuricellaceae bacterium]
MNTLNAEQLFNSLQQLNNEERQHFFNLLSERAFGAPDNLTHQELFGDLKDAEFTALEAAQYLDISIATFRRYLKDQKIAASATVGNVHLYSLCDLRKFRMAKDLLKH